MQGMTGSPVSTTQQPALSGTVPDSGPAQSAAIDYSLVNQIGVELSLPVNTMRAIAQGVEQNHQISTDELKSLLAAVESASDIARQSQQIARLAEGRFRQSHERIHLDELLQVAVRERTPALQARAGEARCSLKPLEIIVDPGLLSSLIDAALDWASAQGPRLMVSLDIKNWPEHGLLTIKASSATGSNPHPASPDSLKWHLLKHLAQTMDVTLEREIRDSGEAVLLLEFARTVRKLEGLTAMEFDDASGDSAFHTGTRPMAGLRVLLVSNDPMVRAEVAEAGHSLGLRVDTVPSVPQALHYARLDLPNLIIIDEQLHDDAFDQLMNDTRSTHPNFSFLEITEDANTFEISSWMSDSMTRVSRHVLRAQLPSVLSLELARGL